MHARVNTLHLLAALSLLILAPPAPADTEERESPIDRLWIPSLAPTAGVAIQKMEGSVSSSCANGGERILDPLTATVLRVDCEAFPDPPAPGPLRPAASGSQIIVTPYVGGSLQVLSPVIPFVPGRPRAFLNAEAHYLFSTRRDVATEGSPSRVGYSRQILPGGRARASTDALTGVGSRTSAEVQPWGFGGNLGLAFPVDVVGRRLWLKPLVGYYRYKVDIDYTLVAGFKERCGGFDDVCEADDPRRNFREILFSGGDDLAFNSIGPGMEIELETGRFGPVGSTLFLGLYAYRVLGNRKSSSADTVLYLPGFPQSTCDALGGFCAPPDGVGGPPTNGRADRYSADWEYEANPWIFRSGIGFRFHWVGFQK